MNPLMIANTQIRCDAAGRYCLNDLHQASGGAKRHQPSDWLRRQQTQELIDELVHEDRTVPGNPGTVVPVETIQGGFVQGTYAVKELVYAYAMWISAAFHLHVIRAYDALVQQRTADVPPPLARQPQHRADQMVSAGRIFAAAYRTARAARMPYPKALQAATACAHRHTGIDWQEECGFDLPASAAELSDPLRDKVEAALSGRINFQMAALIGEHALGMPDDTGLMARIAAIARSLGWRSRRRRTATGSFFTEWRRSTE